MAKEIIYESELHQGRLILSYVIISLICALIVWLEYWIIVAFGLMSGQVLGIIFFSATILLLLGIPLTYLTRYVLEKKPKLIVYTDCLSIGEQTVSFREIKNITIDGQIFSTWVRSPREEVVIINLTSGNSLTVIVSRYRNGNLFRSVCETIKKNIVAGTFTITKPSYEKTTLNAVDFNDLANENFRKFKPNILFSMSFYVSVVVLAGGVMILKMPLKDTSFRVNLFFFSLNLLMSLTVLLLQRYFLVSGKYLVIKNYFYFWMVTIICMEDIKRIQALRVNRGRQLVIMTRDNEVHIFRIDPTYFSNEVDEMVETVKEYIPEYKNDLIQE